MRGRGLLRRTVRENRRNAEPSGHILKIARMQIETESIYPNCPTITRTVDVGGLTKSELIQELQRNSISMNVSAERLFADDRFITSDTSYKLKTVELTLRDLGFPGGATAAQTFERASEVGLELCSLELGPHLRLQYLDQPAGFYFDKAYIPGSGAITIASKKVSEDDRFPNGFYLRRLDDGLWLRGYRATSDWVWHAGHHLIFTQTETT